MKKKSFILSILLLLSLSLWGDISFFNLLVSRNPALKKGKGNYLIVVDKKNFQMKIFHKQTGKVLDIFKIALGLNAGRKTISGDKKTPDGLYFVTEILSLDAPRRSVSYKKLVRMNSVYWKAEHGHYKYGKPDTDLGRDAYGPRFFRLSYPNANDRKRFSRLKKEGKIPRSAGIGSGIAIHGTNDPPSMGGRASSGCIRLLNDKIVTLDRYIVRGTAVLILPD